MIVFLTTEPHRYTVQLLVRGEFGAPVPRCAAVSYETLFRARQAPRATYVFTDLDRLRPWELRVAAEFHRDFRTEGLRVLNDPARAMSRLELLRTLHDRGINPFTVYGADTVPRPARFPVFIRDEDDHRTVWDALLPDQAALDARLEAFRAEGMPLRGLLVVEWAAEPAAPGVWRKYGTFRIGDSILVDHAVIEDRWLVKYGTRGLSTEAMQQEEDGIVRGNLLADAVRPAFEIAGIEWGRADHGTVGGREVVYEINTNPLLGRDTPQRFPARAAMVAFARQRFAEHLHRIDSPEGPALALPDSPARIKLRQRMAAVESARKIRP